MSCHMEDVVPSPPTTHPALFREQLRTQMWQVALAPRGNTFVYARSEIHYDKNDLLGAVYRGKRKLEQQLAQGSDRSIPDTNCAAGKMFRVRILEDHSPTTLELLLEKSFISFRNHKASCYPFHICGRLSDECYSRLATLTHLGTSLRAGNYWTHRLWKICKIFNPISNYYTQRGMVLGIAFNNTRRCCRSHTRISQEEQTVVVHVGVHAGAAAGRPGILRRQGAAVGTEHEQLDGQMTRQTPEGAVHLKNM
ncbi:hypothetical protein Pelo_15979 [Pelomyxa schiedti]|nr:hypothetical protein Pelo_15979 [Pelomyxa schiedti]